MYILADNNEENKQVYKISLTYVRVRNCTYCSIDLDLSKNEQFMNKISLDLFREKCYNGVSGSFHNTC